MSRIYSEIGEGKMERMKEREWGGEENKKVNVNIWVSGWMVNVDCCTIFRTFL